MAIGWLTVLKSVPWGEVISNAPKVADGAKKLWNSVGKKAPLAESAAGAATPSTHDPGAASALQTRLAAVESAAVDLHGQMLASSELIKSLAEQNAQLIRGIEANRIRLRWVTGAVIAIGCVVTAGLVWLLGR